MARYINPTERDPSVFAQCVHELQKGKSLNFGDFTLRASQTTTTVSHPNCSVGCKVLYFPETLHAAAEIAGGAMFIATATILQGSFVVTHASNAQADRTFGYILVGGT